MTRLSILAVLAGATAIVVGGLVLSGGGPGPASLAVPSAPPSPSAASTASGPAADGLRAPLPDAVKGGWSAASRGTAMEGAGVTTIVLGGSSVDPSAPLFSLDYPGMPSRMLASYVVEETPGILLFELSTVDTRSSGGCDLRSEGRYRWSRSADGQWLTLEPVSDACAVREQVLAGTWQRNVGFNSPGGPGIAVNFEPYVALTLPARVWTGMQFFDTDTVHTNSDDRGFKIWRDLDGFVDPCDRSKGRLLIDPGMDAFLEYLREDPRFRVTDEKEFEIDGHRAVQVDFRLGEGFSEPCWDFDGDPDNKTGVLLWIPEREPNPDAFWNGEIDSPGQVIVTEVDGVTLAFEAVVVDPAGTLTADREILDTIRFLDALPEPPPG